jgi:hypothetical protein
MPKELISGFLVRDILVRYLMPLSVKSSTEMISERIFVVTSSKINMESEQD